MTRGGDRPARALLLGFALALVAGALAIDLPAVSNGTFWGDSATYHAMAWSLAEDLDLRYEAHDLARTRREYPSGPQGLFLKRASGGLTIDTAAGFPWLRRVRPDEGRLYYAKAFAHPLIAAPFVRVFGTRGLLLLNALALASALALGYSILRRRGAAPVPALVAVAVLVLVTVTPVYLVWPTPEMLGLSVVMAGLAAWAAGRPLLAAALFGLAGYLKYPNVLLAAPLGLEPLLPSPGARFPGPGFGRRLGTSLRRGAILLATFAAFFVGSGAITGELNYQGGERKTFYDRFPFDERGTTFDSGGFWMVTDQLGPLVEGRDEGRVTARTGPARAGVELVESFAWNLLYFWVGRFGGVLAYFFPALAALLLFLVRGRLDRAGALALVAVVLSFLVYISQIPDNWYGGGGTVGNRYFLSVLPVFLFLLPMDRVRLFVLSGLAAAAVFLLPMLSSPVRHSLRPGDHTMRGAFRLLPVELTMLNDLAVFTEPWRKKRPFGFVGDPRGGRGADPDAFFLYFLDDGTFGKETFGGEAGFWLRAGKRAEIVVRAFDLAPVRRIALRLRGGPLGDVVTVRRGFSSTRVTLGPGQVQDVGLPVGRGLRYYDTYLHVLRLRSRRGAPLADGRAVGAFVSLRLEMGPPFASSEDR